MINNVVQNPDIRGQRRLHTRAIEGAYADRGPDNILDYTRPD